MEVGDFAIDGEAPAPDQSNAFRGTAELAKAPSTSTSVNSDTGTNVQEQASTSQTW